MEEKEIQRMCIKHNRTLWRTILGVITLLVWLAGVVYAGVMQMILCYQEFDVIINSELVHQLKTIDFKKYSIIECGW